MKLKDIENMEYFARGHRGILYKGTYKKKTVVVKTERKDSQAIARVENEVNFLKILNEKGIGPTLLDHDKKFTYFIYAFVEGELMPLWIQNKDKKYKESIKKVIKNVFLQCFRMDRLKINKEEMHHPYKHILVGKKPVMIDFERCHKSLEPKNVTQFSTYIISDFMMTLLASKKIKVNRDKIINAAKKYKKDISKKNLENITKNIR